MSDNRIDRVGELRRFMTAQRARWTRTELGLPHRNTSAPGISTEDLAELICWSPAWVSIFERGKLRHPKPEFLDAIAAALRMTAEERSHLWHLATGMPAPPRPDIFTTTRDNDADLIRMLKLVEPNPAFIFDPAFRVQAHNRAFVTWLCDFDNHPDLEQNFALWMFTDPHAQHVFVEWRDVVTPALIARLRAHQARLPDDMAINSVIESLCRRSRWAEKLWNAPPQVVEWPHNLVMRLPGHTAPGPDDALADADGVAAVDARMMFLKPPREGDERHVVTILLPGGTQTEPGVTSEQACPACQTEPTTRHAASPRSGAA